MANLIRLRKTHHYRPAGVSPTRALHQDTDLKPISIPLRPSRSTLLSTESYASRPSNPQI